MRRSWDRLLTAARRDTMRVIVTLAVGFVFVFGSQTFARWTQEPAFSPWGLFAGAAFFVAALSHILRRLLFHHTDLQAVGKEASVHPIGAGLVFLGICIVLASFVLMMGSMFRT